MYDLGLMSNGRLSTVFAHKLDQWLRTNAPNRVIHFCMSETTSIDIHLKNTVEDALVQQDQNSLSWYPHIGDPVTTHLLCKLKGSCSEYHLSLSSNFPQVIALWQIQHHLSALVQQEQFMAQPRVITHYKLGGDIIICSHNFSLSSTAIVLLPKFW